jgi:hypothetical protein
LGVRCQAHGLRLGYQPTFVNRRRSFSSLVGYRADPRSTLSDDTVL